MVSKDDLKTLNKILKSWKILDKEFEEEKQKFMESPEPWKAEVIDKLEKTFDGKTYNLYKLKHEFLKVFWLSEKKFRGNENLFKIKEGKYLCDTFIDLPSGKEYIGSDFINTGPDIHLEFKAPFNKYFEMVKKTNKKSRKFKELLPKRKITLPELEKHAPYENRYSKRKWQKKIFNRTDPVFEPAPIEDKRKKNKSLLKLMTSEYLNTTMRKIVYIRINKKNILGAANPNMKIDKQKDEKKKSENIKHNPFSTISFLEQFSSNPNLKYLLHAWDKPEFKYDDFIKDVKQELNKLTERYKLNQSTFIKVRNFALGYEKDENKGFWQDLFSNQIFITWESMKSWIEENKRHPFDFKDEPAPIQHILLPDKENKLPKNIKNFKDLITHFRNTIRFTNDNGYSFYSYLKENFKEKGGLSKSEKFEIKFNFNKNIVFKVFLDKERLTKALQIIAEWIRDNKLNKDINDIIKIELENKREYIELIITHVDSKIPYDHNNVKFAESNSGDLNSLLGSLLHICDFSIKARFMDGCYELPFLAKDRTLYVQKNKSIFFKQIPKPIELSKNDCKGVSYIFKFYKTK